MTTRHRSACALTLVLLAALLASACTVTPTKLEERTEDDPGYGRILQQPDAYRSMLLVDPWIEQIKVGGSSTFGREIGRQIRLDIDGAGPLPIRDVTLQTAAAVELFAAGDSRERAETALHGILDILHEHDGFTRGISLTTSRAGFEAAALSGLIQERVVDGEFTPAIQRYLSSQLSRYAREASRHFLAWYDFDTTWITVGPRVSRTLRTHVKTPDKVTAKQGIDAAFIIRHELEHAISPTNAETYARLQWLEEGGADTLARWPGVAAATAKQLGLPYPKRYEQRAYEAKDGYPPWVRTVRILLRAAAIDTTSPDAYADAHDVLQGDDPEQIPERIAAQIARRHGLPAATERRLARGIAGLNGRAGAATKLVRAYL